LTFEDLLENHLSWPAHVLVGDETLGKQICDVIRSEPDAQRGSAYSSVTSWIDRTTLLPVRILKKPIGPGPEKEVVCRGLKKSGGRWVAATVEMRTVGVPGSTRMVFTGGIGKAKVKDSEVDRP
jgi:hypothetical protein